MSHQSSFGGVAGRVVRHFVGLGTLLTTVPTLLTVVLLALGTGWLVTTLHLPGSVAWLLGIVVLAPVAGRFGLAAREGDITCGFFSAGHGRGVFGFALRYALLALIWGLPLGLLGPWLVAGLGGGVVGLFGGIGLGGAKAALVALGALLGLVLAVLAPALSMILALSADSVAELFELARWRWLLVERRGDLPAFFAALIGGLTLFYALALPLLLAIDGLLFGSSLRAGAFFAPLVPLLPAAGAPILLGRLAGSIVATSAASDEEDAEPELIARRAIGVPGSATGARAAAAPVPAGVGSRAAPGIAPSPASIAGAADTPGVSAFVKRARQLGESDPERLQQALAEGEALRRQQPRHVALLAELARLQLKAGQHEAGLGLVATTIELALESGGAPVAVELFQGLGAQRPGLVLAAPVWERLARCLLERQRFAEAAWCFVAALAAGHDAAKVQKGLIAVAEAAARGGAADQALQLYAYLLEHFPGSPFQQYCEDAARTLRARQGSR